MMPGQFGNRGLSDRFDDGQDDASIDADERLWVALAAIRQIAGTNESVCMICEQSVPSIATRNAGDGFLTILTLIDQAEAAFGELERVRINAAEETA